MSSSGWAKRLDQAISSGAFPPQPFSDTVNSVTAFLFVKNPKTPWSCRLTGHLLYGCYKHNWEPPKTISRMKVVGRKKAIRERQTTCICWFYSWNLQHNINPKYSYFKKILLNYAHYNRRLYLTSRLLIWGCEYWLLCYFKQGFFTFWRLCYHADKTNSFFSDEEIPLFW